VYFGAYDLSQALGHPGNTKHPEVVQAIQQGVNLVNGADKYAGGFVPQSKNEIQELLDMGMKFITYEVDSSIIHKHVDDVSSWFLRTKNE
jgi:4-hydroxy-2-oxoheptanedioate aldolase